MTRIINLCDWDNDFLVETDAPANEIEKAIEYKDKMLIENDPSFRSDFEEMQDYLQQKGYTFEQIGYITDLESYEW